MRTLLSRRFTAAAVSLGISQAAVSQRISLLEKDLGTGLFDRHAGRIQLTEAGQRQAPHGANC